MCCYEILDLIISGIGVLATFFIGWWANRISKAIKEHNIAMDNISLRPLPILEEICIGKSSGTEDYDHHMRFYFGNMDKDELTLDNQIYTKLLDGNNQNDVALLEECRKNAGHIYFTYVNQIPCIVCNFAEMYGNLLFEYRSSCIKIKNYKNDIISAKINYMDAIYDKASKQRIQGINKDFYITIADKCDVNIMMCFATNTPEHTLCVNSSKEYRKLPDKETNFLKTATSRPYLKYEKLILNCTFGTVDELYFEYEIIVSVTSAGFETKTICIRQLERS